jgi:hypothetical protein
MLAQQASGYDIGGHNFHTQEKPMCEDLEFSHAGTDGSTKPTALVGLADPLVDASQSAKPTGLVSLVDFPSATTQLAKPTGPVCLANSLVANPTNLPKKLSNRPNRTSSDIGVLSNMCCIMMSSIGEPLRTCY